MYPEQRRQKENVVLIDGRSVEIKESFLGSNYQDPSDYFKLTSLLFNFSKQLNEKKVTSSLSKLMSLNRLGKFLPFFLRMS